MTDVIVYQVDVWGGGDSQIPHKCFLDKQEASEEVDRLRAMHPTYHQSSLASARHMVADLEEVKANAMRRLTPLEKLAFAQIPD